VQDKLYYFYMNFLTQIPVHFIDTVTPGWAAVVVFCATTLGIIIMLYTLGFLILRRLPYQSAFSTFEHIMKKTGDVFVMAITAFAAYFFSVIFKDAFMVGRPVAYTFDLHPLLNLSGYGFPSSHAAFYSAIAVTLFFTNKTAGYIAMFLAAVVCVARVLAGVHSPADIIGGIILGVLISCLIDFVVEKLNDWKTV